LDRAGAGAHLATQFDYSLAAYFWCLTFGCLLEGAAAAAAAVAGKGRAIHISRGRLPGQPPISGANQSGTPTSSGGGPHAVADLFFRIFIAAASYSGSRERAHTTVCHPGAGDAEFLRHWPADRRCQAAHTHTHAEQSAEFI
jgi:hypothetical protein